MSQSPSVSDEWGRGTTPGFLVLRDLLENFGKTFNQRSRAAFSVSFRHEFQPRTTHIASEIATQRDYGYPVSVSTVSCRETRLPVSDRAKSSLSRIICKFLGCWQPDVCHEAASEMSSSDEGE
jgi:hypothetical protein